MTYIYPPYNRVVTLQNELQLPRSLEVLKAIELHPFCEFMECGRFDNGNEFLVLELEIERGQFAKNDIKSKEKMLIEVAQDDKMLPSVFALREDFPQNVSHLNLMPFDTPKSLCLSDQPVEELKLIWTGFSYLEGIRSWLKLTAEGKLHQDDQPLEPFFIDSIGNIILPHPIIQDGNLKVFLSSYTNKKQFNFIAFYETEETQHISNNDYHLLTIQSNEVVHGVIQKAPTNFKELSLMLSGLGTKLLEKINELCKINTIEKKKILLLLLIPTKRHVDGSETILNKYSFLIDVTIDDLSKSIGLRIPSPIVANSYIFALESFFVEKEREDYIRQIAENGSDVPVYIVKPHVAYNISMARQLNGLGEQDFNVCQIGVGAIGSQVFTNLSRAGFGKQFDLFDDDVFLPHNLSRHVLSGSHIGKYKSRALAVEANFMLNSTNYSSGISEKISTYLISEESIDRLKNTSLIIDASVSIATSRFISNLPNVNGRRVSIFLNPSGSDLVVLAEDTERNVKLNQLEMLYYKAIVDDNRLKNHLVRNTSQVRYANSCRDVSFVVPNENVSILSGIATGVIKKSVSNNNCFAGIWRISSEDFGIDFIEIPVSKFTISKIDGWQIIISETLVKKLITERINKLPNETGGILIGCFDMESKEIYIVDSIFSPEDSIETPTSFIRGVKGVKEKIEDIEKSTMKNLTYIGEWHSHPTNSSVVQSPDDKNLFLWMTESMLIHGLPSTMIIVGDTKIGIYSSKPN